MKGVMYGMTKYIVALDVGGTFIKAGIVTANGDVLEHTINQYEAQSDDSKEQILQRFRHIFHSQMKLVPDAMAKDWLGVGLAFPGPFDYAQGISYIRGQGKFDALYGINLKNE